MRQEVERRVGEGANWCVSPVLPRASVVLTGAAPSKQGRQVELITLVRDGRLLLIDVAFVEARPSPWRQAVDLANMMLCLALRSSAEQVYRRALRQFSVDEISEGSPPPAAWRCRPNCGGCCAPRAVTCTANSCGCCRPRPNRSGCNAGAPAESGCGL